MAAFREAIRQGADTIELDLQITKDDVTTGRGAIVVAHNAYPRADQCLSPEGKRQDRKKKSYIRDMTLAQLQRFDCGSIVRTGATPVPGEKIPALSEALKLLKENKGLRFDIEIKFSDPKFYPPLEAYIDEIIRTIEESGTEAGVAGKPRVDPKRFFIESFHFEALEILKKKRSRWQIAPSVDEVKDSETVLFAAVQKLSPPVVSLHHRIATQDLLRNLKGRGIEVIVWTVNTRDEMLPLIEKGVDGIITDRVDVFMNLKEELCSK